MKIDCRNEGLKGLAGLPKCRHYEITTCDLMKGFEDVNIKDGFCQVSESYI